jgi:gluconolactonase
MLYPISGVHNFINDLNHPEGVATGRDGTVYAGGEAGEVYRISPDGSKVETIASTGGFCLGVTLDQAGSIIVCDLKKRALLRVSQSGCVELVLDSVAGRPLVSPNFSVFDSRGNLYFSDSGEWKRDNGVIYRLSCEGEAKVFAPGPFYFANGLALDAGEKYLYVVESNLDRVIRIAIKPDGSAGITELHAEGIARVPDGLAFDAEGSLYVTTYANNCIYRVTPQRRLELISRDDETLALCQPTNCAFGGPNFDQLLVANLGRDHLSVLDLKIKGQPLWCHTLA